ncbi:MAG: GNAT family N-acetyltransferase [Ferruginibacter sp.]|nr:GNAT family N-acetyltransferase [Ferruginibacter sp.]
MNITIRKAITADIPGLSSLFDRYRVFYNKQTDIGAARLFIMERIKQGDAEIFVAETEDGTLAGFTQLYPLFSSTRMQKMWLLNDLYVSENFRGQGISKALIAAAKALATETNACGLLLETAKTNTIGNQLYPATGFELQDESNFYFWTNK